MSATDEKTFEERVVHEFEALLTLERMPFSKNPKERGIPWPFNRVLMILAPLEERALKQVRAQKSHQEFDYNAERLLSKMEIKKSIRDSIVQNGNKFVLTPTRFCQVMTESLNKVELMQKYSYRLDHELVAFVAFKVHKQGLQEFCSEVEYETR